LFIDVLGRDQVPKVNRIKTAAQKADLHAQKPWAPPAVEPCG
jgi:hypothetical protein